MCLNWKSWAVVFLAIVIAVLLAELGLRGLAFATDNPRGATFDPELGWKLVPNVSKKNRQWCNHVPATTNSFGWRDKEHEVEKPIGVTRMVALGDSFTFGFGVDYGQRFSEFLEEDVPRLEVINMGVFAYGTDQEVLAYELYGKQYKPDIVVLNVFLHNDLIELRLKEKYSFPKPYFVLDQGELTLFKPKLSWSLSARLHSYVMELVFRGVDRFKNRSIVANESEDTDGTALFLTLVERLGKSVRRENARLLVVLIHSREPSDEEKLVSDQIFETLNKRNHDVLDLYQPFAELSRGGADLYLPDGHWNPAGNQLAADRIRDYFLAHKWIIP